jgi:hypothetical protein
MGLPFLSRAGLSLHDRTEACISSIAAGSIRFKSSRSIWKTLDLHSLQRASGMEPLIELQVEEATVGVEGSE